MTHKHTPGPWATDTNGLITAGPRRLHIAQTAVTGMGHAAEANAFLLAAAPDLLEALTLILNTEKAALLGGQLPGMKGLDVPYHFEQARAAIRKALEG